MNDLKSYLSILIDHIDSTSLIAARYVIVRVQGSTDNCVVKAVAIHVRNGHRVTEIRSNL